MVFPKEVQSTLEILIKGGFEAFVVGGSVRDILLGVTPKDWDVTTNATPEDIQKLFPKHFYANRFGTVTVQTGSEDLILREIEVTTYRTETGYSDNRHPDAVKFVTSLSEDLARRDFTINAMAAVPADMYQSIEGVDAAVIEDTAVIDLFGGIQDLHKKVIRAVGDPNERFTEDALRMMRAVRFSAELDFDIEEETFAAVKKLAASLESVSGERIRDELIKIVMSSSPEHGFNLLERAGLLEVLFPEIAEGVGVGQNKHHIYTVFEHNVKSLQFAADFEYPLHIRLAALLHDIGKPKTKRPQGNDFSFHGHEFVGARMAERFLKRLHFSTEMVKKVSHLVRYHMFYYDVGKVTEAGARRLLRRVGGKENFEDLIKLRIAERKGSGVPKAEPYRLRHLQFLIEKASQEPISVNQLAIKGADLVTELGMTPGPAFGGILNALLAEVLDDPKKNTREYLLERAGEIKDKDIDELRTMGEAAVEEAEARREEDIRRKYKV